MINYLRKVKVSAGKSGVILNLNLAHVYHCQKALAIAKDIGQEGETIDQIKELVALVTPLLELVTEGFDNPFDPEIWSLNNENNLIHND